MLKLFPDWMNGDKINLNLVEKMWEIEIETKDGLWCFGKGWMNFAEDTALEVNDILICYNFFSNPAIYVCIVKGIEIIQPLLNSGMILLYFNCMDMKFG